MICHGDSIVYGISLLHGALAADPIDTVLAALETPQELLLKEMCIMGRYLIFLLSDPSLELLGRDEVAFAQKCSAVSKR
jgi:hypothetical protein